MLDTPIPGIPVAEAELLTSFEEADAGVEEWIGGRWVGGTEGVVERVGVLPLTLPATASTLEGAVGPA